MARTVTVSSPAMPSLLGSSAFEFKSMKGGESLGNLFGYVIQLQTPDSPMLTEAVSANLPIKDLVGKDFSVVIELDGKGFLSAAGAGTREINGLVTQARYVYSEDRRSTYEVLIEPWLTLATRTSDYKIFQNQTPLEIIEDVLTKYSYPIEKRVSQTYPQREYQVQYGETDFHFISRLMEEFGIYYFFEHKDGKHTLILVDDVGAHKPSDSAAYQSVNYYGTSAKLDEEYCDFFDVADTLVSGKWVTDDFDFKKPKAKLRKNSKMPRQTGNADQEMYRWPGDYVVPEEGEQLARVRMEEAGSGGKRARGAGNLRGMVPGCTVSLQNHPQDTSNRDWLILATNLEIHESGHASGQEDYWCRTEFMVQPANDTYRSPQTHFKPRTAGPQTAIVTGPAGQEIWTNEYGQVKVSFHWNRYCTKDENSSCWIRVSSPWAGNGFGGISIPRIGQEVIVDFENGDPDRPIILGRLWNAMNMPPWALPGSMTQSGMLTRSSPGGGAGNANALRFEDKAGQEEMWLQAEKDMRADVKNDEAKWVGNDRTKTIDGNETNVIHKNRTETVDLDENITVHQNRTERVDLDESVDIGLNQKLTVGLNRDKTIGLNEVDNIGMNWTANVGMFKTESIGMGLVQNVGLFKVVNVGITYTLNTMFMLNNVLLSRTDNTGTDHSINVGNKLSINAGDCIELICGGSSLVMTKDGKITVNGNEIDLAAGSHMGLESAKIDIN